MGRGVTGGVVHIDVGAGRSFSNLWSSAEGAAEDGGAKASLNSERAASDEPSVDGSFPGPGNFRTEEGTSGRGAISAISRSTSPRLLWAARASTAWWLSEVR